MGSKWVVAREKEAKNLGGKGESKTLLQRLQAKAAELKRYEFIVTK